jgi:N-methylhydantoinase B
MAPYGLAGGKDGTPGENSITRSGAQEALPAKVNMVCKKGDIVRIATPGGGGYGKPKKIA